jgi:hypothetical protein
MYGTLELGVYGSLDLRILSVPPENKKRCLCIFASRLVPRIFLESHGTLVTVSLLAVSPLAVSAAHVILLSKTKP